MQQKVLTDKAIRNRIESSTKTADWGVGGARGQVLASLNLKPN